MSAKTLAGSGQSEEYGYDSEHERIKQVSSQSGTQRYFNPGKGSGLFYEKQTGKDGKVEHKPYLSANGEVIGEVVKRDNPAAGQAAEEERYWVKDHLGSNRAVLGSSGQLLESLGFDAWGKRRLASGQTDAANPGIAGVTTDRGYTGHEHLDALGLVNMNARIYDPLLGRFLSPDPEVTDTERMQNFNRYSYVLNNPLAYTDPSGESWLDSVKDFFGFGKADTPKATERMPAEHKQAMDNLARFISADRSFDSAKKTADQLVKAGFAVEGINGSSDYEASLGKAFKGVMRECGKSCRDYFDEQDFGARLGQTAGALRSTELAAMGGADQFGGGAATLGVLAKASGAFKRALEQVNKATRGDDLAKMSGQLRDAAKGKGNFGLGNATRSQADDLGKAWVGDGAKLASDGKTLVIDPAL